MLPPPWFAPASHTVSIPFKRKCAWLDKASSHTERDSSLDGEKSIYLRFQVVQSGLAIHLYFEPVGLVFQVIDFCQGALALLSLEFLSAFILVLHVSECVKLPLLYFHLASCCLFC